MAHSDNATSKRSRRSSTYRYRIRHIRFYLSTIRLGRRGKEALSILLTAEELPMDTLGFFRFERAYPPKRAMARKGDEKEYKNQIIVERSFAIPGVNRFISIALRPYRTIEEVTDAYDYFTESVKKRFAHFKSALVTESAIVLTNLPNTRVVETQVVYAGEDLRHLSVASVFGTELLVVDFQCSATSQWSVGDCEEVVRLQIFKLEGRTEIDNLSG
jgi:hypothetical protein